MNSKIIVDRHPKPNIHEMLSMLESAKVFTSVDLSSAYQQIPLMEESKDITSRVMQLQMFKFVKNFACKANVR